MYSKYITDKDFRKARKSEQECLAELERQKKFLEEIVESLGREVEDVKRVTYGEGMIYMEVCCLTYWCP